MGKVPSASAPPLACHKNSQKLTDDNKIIENETKILVPTNQLGLLLSVLSPESATKISM